MCFIIQMPTNNDLKKQPATKQLCALAHLGCTLGYILIFHYFYETLSKWLSHELESQAKWTKIVYSWAGFFLVTVTRQFLSASQLEKLALHVESSKGKRVREVGERVRPFLFESHKYVPKCFLVFLSIPQRCSTFLSFPQHSSAFLSVPLAFHSIPECSLALIKAFLSVPQHSLCSLPFLKTTQSSLVFLTVIQHSFAFLAFPQCYLLCHSIPQHLQSSSAIISVFLRIPKHAKLLKYLSHILKI